MNVKAVDPGLIDGVTNIAITEEGQLVTTEDNGMYIYNGNAGCVAFVLNGNVLGFGNVYQLYLFYHVWKTYFPDTSAKEISGYHCLPTLSNVKSLKDNITVLDENYQIVLRIEPSDIVINPLLSVSPDTVNNDMLLSHPTLHGNNLHVALHKGTHVA